MLVLHLPGDGKFLTLFLLQSLHPHPLLLKHLQAAALHRILKATGMRRDIKFIHRLHSPVWWNPQDEVKAKQPIRPPWVYAQAGIMAGPLFLTF